MSNRENLTTTQIQLKCSSNMKEIMLDMRNREK